jgi:hypothetical protein
MEEMHLIGKQLRYGSRRFWLLEVFRNNLGELVEVFLKSKWKKFEQGFREARGNQFVKHQDSSTCRLRVA